MTLANDAYVTVQKEHLAECEQDLYELQSILEQRPWGRLERAAAERTNEYYRPLLDFARKGLRTLVEGW